jgi:hypothetical protein
MWDSLKLAFKPPRRRLRLDNQIAGKQPGKLDAKGLDGINQSPLRESCSYQNITYISVPIFRSRLLSASQENLTISQQTNAVTNRDARS